MACDIEAMLRNIRSEPAFAHYAYDHDCLMSIDEEHKRARKRVF